MTAIVRKAGQRYLFFVILTNLFDLFWNNIADTLCFLSKFEKLMQKEMKRIIIWAGCCLLALSSWAQNTEFVRKREVYLQECEAWVNERLSAMTLKEKIGQLFIHTVEPVSTPQNRKNILDAVKDCHIGGLLFSGGQMVEQVKLTNWAQEMAEIPLMITFDGEWGLAMRLKNTTSFPKNRVLGCIQNNDLLYEYGKEVARQCREIGVHVNFAPVADVDNNPRNPVINTRSFGGDPRNVAEKVVAYSKGLEDGGVLAVCKHFPGHGDTNVDSHKALPVLNFTRERLDSIELYPFREAIKAGVSGVMVGHLEVPAISAVTASLSSEMIDFLRGELGFDGLVFTDALEMKGVSGNTNVCARALMAGNDLLLAPRNLKRELDGVLKAVKEGKLTEQQITEKCRRVLIYKYLLGLSTRPQIQLSGLEQRLNTPASLDLLARLEKEALTVVSNDGGILPMEMPLQGTALLNIGKPSSGFLFQNRLQRYMTLTSINAHPDSIAALRKRLAGFNRVVVAIYTEKYEPYRSMLHALSKEIPVVYAYLTPMKRIDNKGSYWCDAAAVVMGHSSSKTVQEHMADVLVGREKALGRLSVEVKGYRMPGEGVVLDLQETKVYRPEDYGMDATVLAQIDKIAMEGIEAEAYPGCQIQIWKDGAPVYDKCFGHFTYAKKRKVQADDLYDVASLTKTTATLLAVMKLYDQGKFGLTDKISKYVPELKDSPKGNIVIEDLLMHQSGLPAFWPFYREAIDDSSYQAPFVKARRDANHATQIDTRSWVASSFEYKKEWVSPVQTSEHSLQIAEGLYVSPAFSKRMLEMIASDEIQLRSRAYRYSCLNFMLLKEMVENISGMPMDAYLDKEFYQPMGMNHTSYRPLRRFKKEQIVPTVEKDYLRNYQTLQGYVHDEIAAFMGGVSGNAGLFSTAEDVAKVYQMLVDKGIYKGKRYFSLETCNLFLTHTSRISRRGLGFDKPDTKDVAKNPCAEEAPAEVFGHTGFTGTCAWADPKNRLVFVFISNRIYPRVFDHKKLMSLNIRPRIQQVMYQSLIK